VFLRLTAPTPAAVLWPAAALTWLGVGAFIVARAEGEAVVWSSAELVLWCLFGAAFGLSSFAGESFSGIGPRFLLVLQSVPALALAACVPEGVAAPLVVIAGARAAAVLSGTGAAVWVVAQTALAWAALGGREKASMALVRAASLLALQAAAVLVVHLAEREGRARIDLARARDELRLAADEGPRERAAELPGDLGEHLTTLSLSLESGSPLFVMMGAQAASVLSWRDAVGWLLAQAALLVVPLAWSGPPLPALGAAAAVLTFQALACAAVHLAAREARPRVELARLRKELRAAQQRLAEGARASERLRIARELHDVVGHHLSALSLNLEVAAHLADVRAAVSVGTARGLTRSLLTKVREVVSALREDAVVDLASALRALAEDVPSPAVHLELPEALAASPADAETTCVLLRCVQEIITNAARHAGARNLWVTVEMAAAGLTVSARDDGRGVDGVRPGNGLRGMRERLELAGGRLELASRPGQGFAVKAVLPLTRASA
jgi:signal transduction histidine kinase